jgi:UDP-N-acetylglucosamine 1-carboxyvinyltransferase
MQSQMMALLLTAEGHKVVTETTLILAFILLNSATCINLFSNTVSVTTLWPSAVNNIEGKSQLQGAQVKATDLRAAAALILAGLVAEGTTQVTELNLSV